MTDRPETPPGRPACRVPWLGALAVAAALGVALWRYPRPRADGTCDDPAGAADGVGGTDAVAAVGGGHAQARQHAWRRIEPALEAADAEALDAVERSLDLVREFFDDARRHRVPAFAGVMLSLPGKWRAMGTRMGEESEYRRFVQRSFEDHVFTPADLRGVVEAAAADFANTLAGQHNRLLVRLRADLAVEALPAALADATGPVWAPTMDALAAALAVEAAEDLRVGLYREGVSWAGGEAAAAAISSRLLVSLAGRLGGPAAAGRAGSGWVSLSVGLAAAIAVDLTMDGLLRAAGHDPGAQVTARVRAALDHLEALLLDGDAEARACLAQLEALAQRDGDEHVRAAAADAAARLRATAMLTGLRQELQHLARRQGALRREALRRVIVGDRP